MQASRDPCPNALRAGGDGPGPSRSTTYAAAAGSRETPAPTIVVGLGNDIAGDDGVGILAARILRQRLRDRPDVDVIELPWAGLHLLTALRDRRRAILVDSLRSRKHPPGTVVRLSERDLAGSVRLNSFHDLNYPTALALGRALDWSMPDHVEIYAVEGESFDRFESRLTPGVRGGLGEVVRLVMFRLAALRDSGDRAQTEVIHACCVQS